MGMWAVELFVNEPRERKKKRLLGRDATEGSATGTKTGTQRKSEP